VPLPRHAGLAMVGVGGVAFGFLLLMAWQGAVVIDGHRYYALRDDAMISMRYAYHLARGDGLVWNPGEYVQGFTNLGWTLVMAPLFWLPGHTYQWIDARRDVGLTSLPLPDGTCPPMLERGARR
jgi:hypothetical protein